MRSFLLLSLLLLITACGNDTPSATNGISASEPPVAASLSEPATENTLPAEQEQIDLIRSEYELIAREFQAEVYAKDSIVYDCYDEPVDGQFDYYVDQTGALRLATNSYTLGDHMGVLEHWYFRDGTPFFMLREEGSWRFGGELEVDEEGNEYPGTVDNIAEHRFYFADGALIRHLVKEYEIKSWEEAPDPASLPNETVAHNGEMPETWPWVKDMVENRTLDCGKVVLAE